METNTRTIINYNTWERRDNFEFFKNYLNPCYSVTCDVECTKAFLNSKNDGSSFFLKYLYAILRAVNEIPELRYRLETVELEDQTNGEAVTEDVIVLYKHVSVITPIATGNNGRFHSVNIPYRETYSSFCKIAKEIIENIPKETNPYAAENGVNASKHRFMDMILVAANPGLAFTSMTCTQSSPQGSKKPLINVGKATLKEGKYYIPVFINVHHGFCDGFHLTKFYNLVEEHLREL